MGMVIVSLFLGGGLGGIGAVGCWAAGRAAAYAAEWWLVNRDSPQLTGMGGFVLFSAAVC